MNDDGDNGNTRIHGQKKSSFFKWLDLAGAAASAFGKDDDRYAVFNNVCRLIQTFYGGPSIRTVDTDITGAFHGMAENRYFVEFGFGKPSELNGKMRLENRNVEIAHMVGHVDIGLSGFQVGEALYGDPDVTYRQNAFCPNPSNFVHRVATDFEKGENDHHHSHKGGYKANF